MARGEVSNDSRFPLTDTLSDMLRDRASQLSPDDFQPTPRRSNVVWATGSVIGTAGATALLLAAYAASSALLSQLALAGAVVMGLLATFCVFKQREVAEHNEHAEKHDQRQLQRLTMLESTRLQHRSDAMQSLKDLEIALRSHQSNEEIARIQANAQIKAAEYQALGVSRDYEFQEKLYQLQHNLTAKESKKERKWKAQEAQKDRELTIDQLITKFEGQLNEVRFRMEWETPDAKKRSEDELTIMNTRISMLKQINKIKDPVLHKQMFDQFRRGFTS